LPDIAIHIPWKIDHADTYSWGIRNFTTEKSNTIEGVEREIGHCRSLISSLLHYAYLLELRVLNLPLLKIAC
jgi:hypothetical protein